jgi:hypothetical protein
MSCRQCQTTNKYLFSGLMKVVWFLHLNLKLFLLILGLKFSNKYFSMCCLTVTVICQCLAILPENGTMPHSYCHLMLIELDYNGVLLKYERYVCYIVCIFWVLSCGIASFLYMEIFHFKFLHVENVFLYIGVVQCRIRERIFKNTAGKLSAISSLRGFHTSKNCE